MSQTNFTPQDQRKQLDTQPRAWLNEIETLDAETPNFDAYPWRGILRVAYWCYRRNLSALGELVLFQFEELAIQEGDP